MNADIELGKAAMLKAHTEKLQAEKGLSFPRAWAEALAAHPELQELHSGEELHPTDRPAFVASQGYRYDPDRKHTAPKGTSWRDVLALMKKYALERVEAAPQSDHELPSKKNAIKVYGQGIPL